MGTPATLSFPSSSRRGAREAGGVVLLFEGEPGFRSTCLRTCEPANARSVLASSRTVAVSAPRLLSPPLRGGVAALAAGVVAPSQTITPPPDGGTSPDQ